MNLANIRNGGQELRAWIAVALAVFQPYHEGQDWIWC